MSKAKVAPTKVISVHGEWCIMMFHAGKIIENRNWPLPESVNCGWICLHCTKASPTEERIIALTERIEYYHFRPEIKQLMKHYRVNLPHNPSDKIVKAAAQRITQYILSDIKKYSGKIIGMMFVQNVSNKEAVILDKFWSDNPKKTSNKWHIVQIVKIHEDDMIEHKGNCKFTNVNKKEIRSIQSLFDMLDIQEIN